MRMLRNLQTIYQHQGDHERVARSADRILKLSPDLPDALRDRGIAYAEIGYRKGADADFTRYLQLRPEADDADAVRNLLIEGSALQKRLN
jgi:regulator of sirC expression with transglutaminase-like and TPR domain